MNKIIMILIVILVILGAVIIGMEVYLNSNPKVAEIENSSNVALSEKVTDECTEEWNAIQTNTLEANSSEIRLSPNCSITFKKHYTGCNHTTNEYTNIPEELVNMDKQSVQERYPDWDITEFQSNEVIMKKDLEGECGEHYVLRDIDNIIVVFKVENGVEQEYEKTSISTEYLPETDKISFKDGLEVNGKENLSQVLEDYE